MQERIKLQGQITEALIEGRQGYQPKTRPLGTTVVYVKELMPLVTPLVKKKSDGCALFVYKNPFERIEMRNLISSEEVN